MKKLQKAQLEEKARQLTQNTLKEYEIPREYRNKVTLGISEEKEKIIFELYVPGEKPSDAIVISTVTINKTTGEEKIKISNLRLLEASSTTDPSIPTTTV